jgi:hypothetical protein
MGGTSAHEGMKLARAKMAEAGLPDVVMRNFERLFSQVLSGQSGVLTEAELEPLEDIDTLVQVSENSWID